MVKYVKKSGPGAFVNAWLNGGVEELDEAYRKEASREVGEMDRWMKDQIEYDPMGVAWMFEENLFPMIRRAIQYRDLIYKRNKQMTALELDVIKATHAGQDEEAKRVGREWTEFQTERIALCWKIKKIHIMVKSAVLLEMTKDEVSPFQEYEYDPEKS